MYSNQANNDRAIDSHDLYSIGPPDLQKNPPQEEDLELTMAAVDLGPKEAGRSPHCTGS